MAFGQEPNFKEREAKDNQSIEQRDSVRYSQSNNEVCNLTWSRSSSNISEDMVLNGCFVYSMLSPTVLVFSTVLSTIPSHWLYIYGLWQRTAPKMKKSVKNVAWNTRNFVKLYFSEKKMKCLVCLQLYITSNGPRIILINKPQNRLNIRRMNSEIGRPTRQRLSRWLLEDLTGVGMPFVKGCKRTRFIVFILLE